MKMGDRGRISSEPTGQPPAQISDIGRMEIPSEELGKIEEALGEIGAESAGQMPIDSNAETPVERPEIPVHFEKTVEWAFVQQLLPALDYGAPLDGDYEPWGDAMVKAADTWILIEFKGVEDDIKDEKKKYPRSSPARKKTLIVDLKVSPEPPRILWRLQLLREWSHEQEGNQVFPRSPRARSASGARAA